MNKVKINPGLASVIIAACLFAGWQTMLIVSALLLIFCELDDNVRKNIIRVVTFYFALSIVTMGWDLIYDAVGLIFNSINKIINLINGYLDEPISIVKIQAYLFNPITSIFDIANSVVIYIFAFVRFGFIIYLITGKKQKENVISKKIDEFVAKVCNFITVNEQPVQPAVQQQPAQPMQ